MRPLSDLIDNDEPAWPIISDWIAGSDRSAEVLPIDRSRGADCLERLQVTTRSPLGALAYECGGIVVDSWLRILGGGSPGLPSLADANDLHGEPPPALVVAIDAVAGRFAVNGGGLPGEIGEVCFFAPNTLAWESLEMGHGSFVEWALGNGLDDFYASLRWPGWQQTVADVGLDQAVLSVPPPYTVEGQAETGITRSVVPWTELASFWDDTAVQLAGVEDGQTFRLTIED